MAGYNIVFRQRDFTIAAGITNVKSTLGPFRVQDLGLGSIQLIHLPQTTALAEDAT